MDPVQILADIAREANTCTLCDLQFSRKNAVPGEGPANAKIMFVGEGPGFYENEQGRPFVGAAGKFLDELLEKIGLPRNEIFITNVVKCRPPMNRDPEPDEIETCTTHYLYRQIDAIQPQVIVTLGRHSLGLFLPGAKISDVHGQPARVRGRLVVPMYHPAAALHQQSLLPILDKDFMQLPDIIAKARGSTPEQAEILSEQKPKDNPKQLSLF